MVVVVSVVAHMVVVVTFVAEATAGISKTLASIADNSLTLYIWLFLS